MFRARSVAAKVSGLCEPSKLRRRLSSTRQSSRGFSSDTGGSTCSQGGSESRSTSGPCGPPTCMYDSRKYGRNLPANNVCPPFEWVQFIPTGVFRNTNGEILGPDAGKCNIYKNPEYFAFHHMSFFDFHYQMRPCRMPCPKTKRKPTLP